MSVEYSQLWEILLDKHMRKTEMAQRAGIDRNILSNLTKNKYVSLKSLEKICDVLDCDIGDIVHIDRRTYKPKNRRSWTVEEIEEAIFGK